LPLPDTRRLLDTLTNAHLLEQTAHDRYQFHDLLRAYATDQTHHHDTEEERTTALTGVLDWYLHSAYSLLRITPRFHFYQIPLEPSECSSPPLVFSEYREGANWFQLERSNLATAARIAHHAEIHHIAWQIPAILTYIYADHGLFGDWFSASHLALESARRCSSQVGEAALLESLTMACRQSHRLIEALDYANAALRIHKNLGNSYGEARTLNLIGLVHQEGHQIEDALQAYSLSMKNYSRGSHPALAGTPMANLGLLYREIGQPEKSLDLASQALAAAREVGDLHAEHFALYVQCEACLEKGDPESAAEFLGHAWEMARDIDSRAVDGYFLIAQGRVEQALGDLSKASISYRNAVTLHRRIGDLGREAISLDELGVVYRELGRMRGAVYCHGRASAIFRRIDDWWRTAVSLDRLATSLSVTMGIEESAPLWEEALLILGRFSDPTSIKLRQSIKESLSDR
ncbi:tetratricopeptide repeat protein, partial [Streptomyces sp. URMC 129]|uniref:tetratricopeptide repeat protein n=1 Tax=Streptomyces sp. URMC 129 TaxID=3423407 RepID=UPI003F1A21C9